MAMDQFLNTFNQIGSIFAEYHIFRFAQFFPAAEAPQYADTGNSGIFCRQNVHLAVTHIDAAIRTDGPHSLEYHIRRRLSGAVGGFAQGIGAGEIMGAKLLHGCIRLVGNDGHRIPFLQHRQCFLHSGIGFCPDLAVVGIISLVHRQEFLYNRFVCSFRQAFADLIRRRIAHSPADLIQ